MKRYLVELAEEEREALAASGRSGRLLRARLSVAVVGLVVLVLPLAAQLTPCFEECHGRAMDAYESVLAAGGSEGFAVHHGQKVFAPCIRNEC